MFPSWMSSKFYILSFLVLIFHETNKFLSFMNKLFYIADT